MERIFKGSEIVELGIQIEKNGRDFYATLTEQSKHRKAKDIFRYLTCEEEKHIAAFKEILESVLKYEPPELYPRDYFAYMNALASDYVFTQKDKGKEIAKDIKTDREAVELGMRFEKDSILFYEGMKGAVRESECILIDKLILQEQDHLKQLSDLKENL